MSDKISSGQTPSKVLHIRNLPYETSQEELEDLSKQFGRLVKSKLNVGPNRNQAFIEFPDVNSAVNMVHHFMSSAEPAKVRSCPCATPTVREGAPSASQQFLLALSVFRASFDTCCAPCPQCSPVHW